KLVNRWQEEPGPGRVDIAAEMTNVTMEIVSRAILGSDFDANRNLVRDAVKVAQEHVNWQITHLFSLPDRYPTRRNLAFKRALHILNAAVYSIIDQRRSGMSTAVNDTELGTDLLSLLLEARDPVSGEAMSDLELR